MLYDPDRKLAIITPPRTASRSVENVLCGLGFERLGGRHSVDLSLPEGVDRVAIVRNHWDTLVSWWRYLDENRNFGQWLHRWLAGDSGASPLCSPPAMWGRWTRHSDAVIVFGAGMEEDLSALADLRIELPHITDDLDLRDGRTTADLFSDANAEALEPELFQDGWTGKIAALFADEVAELGFAPPAGVGS